MATLSEHQRALVKEAYAAYFKQPTPVQKDKAKKLMCDPTASATTMLIATRYLLGPTFLSYEPETIWMETDPCPLNRDRLMAAVSLAVNPAYYWDYRVFGATTHALNDEKVRTDYVPQCTPEQMAWSVFEAELIFAMTDAGDTVPEFDDPVQAYIATCLFDAGYVTAPVGLTFSNDELAKIIAPDSLQLKNQVEKEWAALPKDRIDAKSFADSPSGVQLTRLADAWNYVSLKTKLLREQLAAF